MRDEKYRITLEYSVVIEYDDIKPAPPLVKEELETLLLGELSPDRPFKFTQVTLI